MLSYTIALVGDVKTDSRFSPSQTLEQELAADEHTGPFKDLGLLSRHSTSFVINLFPLDVPPTSHAYLAEMSVILLARDLKLVDSRVRVRYEARGDSGFA